MKFSSLLIILGLKRHPQKISKKNTLLNRKITNGYAWGDPHRYFFSERLQILIDHSTTYEQYIRCQTMMEAYIAKHGTHENDAWIFYGPRISIAARALSMVVKDLKVDVSTVKNLIGL